MSNAKENNQLATLVIVGLVVVLAAAVVIRSRRASRRVDPDDLGWMSDEWLAEQYA